MNNELLEPPTLEAKLKRLGMRLSFWWRSETTANDVKKAFHAAAKAHEKYAANACTTDRLMREWSNQLACPSFAPELGSASLQNFMIETCTAVKPDATQSREFNELLSSIASTFESISVDEANCKGLLHELLTARKSADKHRSNNEDSGLAEKNCEHWNQRLMESARTLGDKRDTMLRANIDQLLKHLKLIEPLLAVLAVNIDAAQREFSKVTALGASHVGVSTPLAASLYEKPDNNCLPAAAYPHALQPEPETSNHQDDSSMYTGSLINAPSQSRWQV